MLQYPAKGEPFDLETQAGASAATRRQAIRFALIATAVAFGIFLYRRGEPRFDEDFWAFAVAVATPLFILGGSWLWREARWRRWDHRALEALQRGEAPRAQEWVAVTGTARALEQPFRAPLSGRPALASYFKVVERSRTRTATGTGSPSTSSSLKLEGYHLTPTVIEAQGGDVRLRAYPDLTHLEKSHTGSGTSPRAEELAVPGPGRRQRIAAQARLFARELDRVNVAWQFGEIEEPGRTDRKEWALSPGAEVCVLGRWDGVGALLPHPARPSGIPIYAGSLEKVLEDQSGEAKVYLGLGALLLALAAGLLARVLL